MYLIGIDIGTTNWKVIAFNQSGEIVASFKQATKRYHQGAGRSVWRADDVWEAVIRGLASVTEQLGSDRAREVTAISVTSVGEAGLLVDRRGDPVSEIIEWFDSRTEPQRLWWETHRSPRSIYAITGFPMSHIPSINKVMWFKQHDPVLFGRASKWLCVADYVLFKLSGEMVMDFSLASRTMAFDIRGRRWSSELLEEAGIPVSLWPSLVPSGTPLGPLTEEVRRRTGLGSGTTIVAGGHDHVCGALAAGIYRPGEVLHSMGTAEAVLMTLPSPLITESLAEAGFSIGCHAARDRYYIMGGLLASGATIEWLRELFPDLGYGEAFYLSMTREAGNSPPGANGCLFVPHLRGTIQPPDARARGAWLGLGAYHKRADLLRAVLEGLALETMFLTALMHQLTGQGIDSITVTGGGTRNKLWVDIKAAASPAPLYLADVPEATALGAALLGGLGAGVWTDEAEAVASMVPSKQVVQGNPQWNTIYQRSLRRWADLYTALQSVGTLAPVPDLPG
ncbi:FGGY family carbohydrate kinase [Carboxydochorda subterranea]|uniref:FGGY family carbohydrate kinase n=1 Tax=Carboxydichorda subterranea TaxID=3109565 RepID=A0ABZ1BXH0_9FIRM|nr:FGGY family carbohydrate kinase [Limnochorda sp. L945t]WRP17487.1 FGGY family carbohydrate kinase [Limnochorda sp. L945t]